MVQWFHRMVVFVSKNNTLRLDTFLNFYLIKTQRPSYERAMKKLILILLVASFITPAYAKPSKGAAAVAAASEESMVPHHEINAAVGKFLIDTAGTILLDIRGGYYYLVSRKFPIQVGMSTNVFLLGNLTWMEFLPGAIINVPIGDEWTNDLFFPVNMGISVISNTIYFTLRTGFGWRLPITNNILFTPHATVTAPIGTPVQFAIIPGAFSFAF